MPKITRKNKKDRQIIRDWFRSREGQEALSSEDLMTDPYGRPISVMLPEAEVSTLGNAPRDLSKDFLEVLRYGAGAVPILGETLDYAESAYATKYGTDFFGRPMHGPLNAGITTAGIVVPNVVEEPVKAGVKAAKKALPKIGPKLKKFKSSIDWGKWNPDTPNHPELMKEYLDIERRSKADGTWMKNPDGTDFEGPPELFVQMQSKAFKEAFPEGYDKLYRGAVDLDGQGLGLTETARRRNSDRSAEFFSEDRSQAENYSWDDKNTVGSDHAKMQSGIYELAYPKGTPMVAFDATGSHWGDVRKFDKQSLLDQLKHFEELRDTGNMVDAYHANSMIRDIKRALSQENPTRPLSSDADVDKFFRRYKDWLKSKGRSENSDMFTVDIAMFMHENPDLYDRVVLRGLDDVRIGDVNMINMDSAPYPKSLKGNVGTFDLNDPNVFKALIPALGVGAVMSQKKSSNDDMSFGGRVRLNKRRRPGVRAYKSN